MNRLLGFLKSPITLQTYGMIMGFVIALIAAPNQGERPTRLDEIAIDQSIDGHATLAYALFRLSALMHSPNAEMWLGTRLADKGRVKEAWKYYFAAVYRFPDFGLKAGIKTLHHAATDEDFGLAATYLTRAAVLADSAEAYRLLGYIVLARGNPSCARWLKALKYFGKAAERGNAHAQLIVAVAKLPAIGIQNNYEQFLAYLLSARHSRDRQVAELADDIVDRLPDTVPLNPANVRLWDLYPSRDEAQALLAQALMLDSPITVPELRDICSAPSQQKTTPLLNQSVALLAKAVEAHAHE